MKPSACFFFLILLLFSINVVEAGSVITLSPDDSSQSNQRAINEAIETVSNAGGGTVHLNSGIYFVDGPVYVRTNVLLDGNPKAIIRVSKTSSQWFTGKIGILTFKGYGGRNLKIQNFQIDGNLDELPRSFADSDGGDHNCERAIYIQGSTDAFLSNIEIVNMKIYDCYSDGIHVQFANNVLCSDNFVSNCQHSGIFFVSVINGLVEGNEIAGITSDCLRYDNCVDNIFRYNIFYSYTGDNNKGAHKGGQNGVQISAQGYSHGGGSDKPTITQNIEGYGNTFANTGLRDVWIDSTRKGVENVYLHDNKFVEGKEIETDGFSVEGISFTNSPTTYL
jgi:hypothetical protein